MAKSTNGNGSPLAGVKARFQGAKSVKMHTEEGDWSVRVPVNGLTASTVDNLTELIRAQKAERVAAAAPGEKLGKSDITAKGTISKDDAVAMVAYYCDVPDSK
jgi:hypothetical protein